MDEGDQFVMGIAIRLFVDQGNAFCFETIQFRLNIVHFEGDMMNASSPVLDEFGYYARFGGGLKYFQSVLSREADKLPYVYLLCHRHLHR